MSTDAQGVVDGDAFPRSLASVETAAGLSAAAGSTQARTLVATSNAESAALAGVNSRAERVR